MTRKLIICLAICMFAISSVAGQMEDLESELLALSFGESKSEHEALSGSCWLNSYGRGVGVPISTCANDLEENGLLCYPDCESGYSGNGPVCW